jgi:hypothetical protein
MALTSMVAVCISTVFFYSQSRALHFFEVASCCWSVLVNGHRSVPGRLTVDFASDCLDERSRRVEFEFFLGLCAVFFLYVVKMMTSR